MIIERTVRFGQGGRGRKKAREAGESQKPVGRVPRVAKLMALAIRFDQLIRDGVVADQAELARVGCVSRARLTQIMNLLWLSPDLQEQVLDLLATESGRDAITDNELRPIASLTDWRNQRRLWTTMFREVGR